MLKRMRKLTGVCLAALMCLIMASQISAADLIVVLDPGHGGGETGATRTFSGVTYKEEVINQKIANYCKAELETYAGVKVYLTRTSVSNPGIQNREVRVNIAKKKGADVLVSLHNNSTASDKQTTMSGAFAVVPSVKGFPDSKSASAKEARALGKAMLSALNKQVGLKNNGYWYDDELGIIVFGQKSDYTAKEAEKLGISKTVLNQKIPTLIMEHAFVNNPNDCKNYLKTDAQLKKIAVADAAGIAAYYGLVKKDGSDSSDTQTAEEEPVRTGLIKSGSNLYLYGEDGNPMRGLVKYKGKYYYANSKGKLSLGWKTINGKKYYFDKKTGAARTKWQTAGNYKFYFSTKGVMLTKWQTISGKKYYFSKVNGRLLTNYWLKYNGKWYYLNKNGNPLTSCTKTIGGKKYKFDSKGICTNKK